MTQTSLDILCTKAKERGHAVRWVRFPDDAGEFRVLYRDTLRIVAFGRKPGIVLRRWLGAGWRGEPRTRAVV